MKNISENELFSAYLDGELTAAEQAEIEGLLAESPEARQLLDDLRALSSSLQSLPQYKLEEDLSEQVLQLAERQILTDGKSPRSTVPTEPAQPEPATMVLPGASQPTARHRIFTPRNVVYAAATVAAVVLVVVLTQIGDRSEFGEIAEVSHVETAPKKNVAQPDRAEDKIQRAPESEDDLSMEAPILQPADGDYFTKEGTADKKAAVGGRALKPVDERAKGPALLDDVSSLKGDVIRPAPSNSRDALRSVDVGADVEESESGVARGGGGMGGGMGGATMLKNQPGGAPLRPASKKSRGMNWESDALSVPQAASEASNAAPLPALKSPSLAAPESPSLGALKAAAPVATELVTRRDVLVVQCEISADAFASGVFEKVLAKHGIVEEDRYEGPTESAFRKKFKLGKRARKEAGQSLAEETAIAAFPDSGPGATLVYVRATPAQVQGALKQLHGFFPVKTAQVPTGEKREEIGRFAQNLRQSEATEEQGQQGLFGRRKSNERRAPGLAEQLLPQLADQATPPAAGELPEEPDVQPKEPARGFAILRGRKDRRETARQTLGEESVDELYALPEPLAANRVLFVLRISPPVGITAAAEADAAADMPAREAAPAAAKSRR